MIVMLRGPLASAITKTLCGLLFGVILARWKVEQQTIGMF